MPSSLDFVGLLRPGKEYSPMPHTFSGSNVGQASALPPAFRAASRGEEQSAFPQIWRWFVAGYAERKLGCKAEAMPHKLAGVLPLSEPYPRTGKQTENGFEFANAEINWRAPVKTEALCKNIHRD
jgi:hypothetical protein